MGAPVAAVSLTILQIWGIFNTISSINLDAKAEQNVQLSVHFVPECGEAGIFTTETRRHGEQRVI
jgi:hypothetical protein